MSNCGGNQYVKEDVTWGKIKGSLRVIDESKELYIHINGCYIRAKIQNNRSFEIMILTWSFS